MADIYPRKRYTTRRVSTTRRAPARRTTTRRMYQIPRGYPRGTRSELKAVDTTVSQVADTTGAVTLINGIARGDDINERVGRRVKLASVQASIVNYVTPTTGVDQTHRCLIVYDKQANGSAPAITDVLVSASTVALPNLDNRQRFVILYDKLMHLNASGEANSMASFKINKRLTYSVQFNSGDAGTAADIQTGAMYFITIGSIAAGSTAGTFSGRIRVRYTDM